MICLQRIFTGLLTHPRPLTRYGSLIKNYSIWWISQNNSILTTKSKALLKLVSVPHLELCATVLLVHTIAFVRPILSDFLNIVCYCWTDSTVALVWLKQPPSQWKFFVSNRIYEVRFKHRYPTLYSITSYLNKIPRISHHERSPRLIS